MNVIEASGMKAICNEISKKNSINSLSFSSKYPLLATKSQ